MNEFTPIPVTRSSMPPLEEYIEEIKDLWESRWLTNRGLKHREFAEALRRRFNSPNPTLFANGHLALEALIEVFGLTGEVITTPFTFASTTHALVRKGLTPVFGDIRPDNYTLDPEGIEALITPRTSAILPVHVYGALADTEAIQEIADRHGLKVIYDAAHAFDVVRNGVNAAEFGDASMFSFHATKVFHTIEGGAAFVKDPSLIPKLQQERNFGIQGPEHVVSAGGNAKMNEFAAAMGLANLRHLDEQLVLRKHVFERYVERLDGTRGLHLLQIDTATTFNYAYMPLRIDAAEFGVDRDSVMDRLASVGVQTRKYFYPLVSDFDCYADSFDSSRTPIAQRVARQIIALPMYAMLELEQVDHICDTILSCKG